MVIAQIQHNIWVSINNSRFQKHGSTTYLCLLIHPDMNWSQFGDSLLQFRLFEAYRGCAYPGQIPGCFKIKDFDLKSSFRLMEVKNYWLWVKAHLPRQWWLSHSSSSNAIHAVALRKSPYRFKFSTFSQFQHRDFISRTSKIRNIKKATTHSTLGCSKEEF
jgi:hypothetical protein